MKQLIQAFCTHTKVLLAIATLSVVAAGVDAADAVTLGDPTSRPDRLVVINSTCNEDLLAEFSLDDGKNWHSATIYLGATVDEWRTADDDKWASAVRNGKIPAGQTQSTWNYFFDVPMPADAAALRLKKAASGDVVFEKKVDLGGMADVFVIDRRNATKLAGGSLPAPWALKPDPSESAVDSIFCPVGDASAAPLLLNPNLRGWYNIYVGTESCSKQQIFITTEKAKYPVPNGGTKSSQSMREVRLKSADLSGAKIGLALGGSRKWQDVSIHYIRFVPMTAAEVKRLQDVRELAAKKGRPFAGYLETMTNAYYEPYALTLLECTRNGMQLNKALGSTEIYVHAIRIGSKAWYHSDVVDRFMGWGNWGNWMKQGDPMAVALTEGHAAGLKVFADLGMNISYDTDDRRDSTITKHPEYLCSDKKIFLDYHMPGVRDYVVSIAAELMTKYDVDGINLDFARFAPNYAFSEASLVDVVKRIDTARKAAEAKWGHKIIIAARIPSYMYHQKGAAYYSGDHPEFVAALRTWAQNGWIDRVMPCAMGYVNWVNQLSLKRYAAAVSGTNVELWGDLYGGGAFTDTSETQWLNIAKRWLGEGLNGGLFFYSPDRPIEFEQIIWQLRLIN